MNDYYRVLGVNRDATPDEIKKAYRRAAAQHHPDRGGDTAQFQAVEEAYRVLSDPQQRAQHDNPHQAAGGFHFNFGGNPFDINDIFAQAFGGFPGQQRRQQPAQYRTQIWVTLEQVYNGGEHHIQLSNSRDMYRINIPVGVEEGQQMRYDQLIPGAVLIVEFRMHPHPVYQRRGADLYSSASINVLELLVGTTATVRTIAGRELTVTVPAGTKPGAHLRLAGHGLVTNNRSGDHYLLIEAHLPDTISEQLQTAIRSELVQRN